MIFENYFQFHWPKGLPLIALAFMWLPVHIFVCFYSGNEKVVGQKGKSERRSSQIWINQKPQLLGEFISYRVICFQTQTLLIFTCIQNVWSDYMYIHTGTVFFHSIVYSIVTTCTVLFFLAWILPKMNFWI